MRAVSQSLPGVDANRPGHAGKAQAQADVGVALGAAHEPPRGAPQVGEERRSNLHLPRTPDALRLDRTGRDRRAQTSGSVPAMLEQ